MGTWYKRKDGTDVFKVGRYKVLEIFKRPHTAWCCFVWYRGEIKVSNGYHGTSMLSFEAAKEWGISKANQLKII